MIQMTKRQEQMKEKLVGTFETIYSKSFEDYLRHMLYMESQENIVMAEAFAINREELVLKCIKMVLDKREKILKSKPDPNQKTLFEF
jgi:hypothetical protein